MREELPAARTTQLTKDFGSGATAVRALDAVDVTIPARRFTAIMGPSGSGKSTLLHCLAGLENPTSGIVHLGEHSITGLSDSALTVLRRTEVGFVFQAFNLMPTMTAEQNILLPLRLARTNVDRAWFDHVTDILGIRDRLTHLPSELSGGQQQRVAIARALITRPKVIFADEPTGALDTAAGKELLTFLRRCVHELGQTVVMVTHDPTAATYADSVLVLRDGRVAGILEQPTVDTVLAALAGEVQPC